MSDQFGCVFVLCVADRHTSAFRLRADGHRFGEDLRREVVEAVDDEAATVAVVMWWGSKAS